jgi:methylated-DNA-[protein]-cysteine S-methyltransferase
VSLRPPTPDPAAAAAAAARFAATADAPVAYAVHDLPVGRVVLAATRRGLARVAYEDHGGGLDAVLDDLAARLGPVLLEQPARLDEVRRQLDAFFAGDREAFDLELDLALATPFGRRVLAAARAIPRGRTATYGEVARRAGSPGAVRAAGTALGRNPVPIVVPCHRVLPASGGLGRYTGGEHRKAALLAVEGVAPEGPTG